MSASELKVPGLRDMDKRETPLSVIERVVRKHQQCPYCLVGTPFREESFYCSKVDVSAVDKTYHYYEGQVVCGADEIKSCMLLIDEERQLIRFYMNNE
jgi:hypothetical protein